MDQQEVGVDVGAKKLQVLVEGQQQDKVDNTHTALQDLVKRLTRGGQTARVCLEATGNYSLDLALALGKAPGIEVMVVNPRASGHFFKALVNRSRTDPVDAQMPLGYVRRMDFVPWTAPASELLQLRTIARRTSTLTELKTEEKNRLHAAKSTDELKCIRRDVEVNINHLARRLKKLGKEAASLVNRHSHLQAPIARLTSVKGIALLSAIRIFGELGVLAADMTARQWVAHAGLDPRHVESGTLAGKTRISKAGNKYLRSALYMPALTAIRHQPNVRAFCDHLLEAGKLKMQANVAVMRKLLHAIHGMLRHDADFDGEKFYRLVTA